MAALGQFDGSDSATQPATAPGVVTVSQPRMGILSPWRCAK